MTTKLYHHKTDGGAEYLCTSPIKGTDEGDLYTALIRLDGEPELIRPITPLKTLERIERLIKAGDDLYGLLVEGLTDAQNDAWNEEIGEFLEALEEAKED